MSTSSVELRLIEVLRNRLAQPPSIAVEWMQPPNVVMFLTVVSILVLLVLLFMSYYYPIGRNVGAKFDIRFRPAKRPANERPANGDWTRYIVQSSLDEKAYDWWDNMLPPKSKRIDEDETKPDTED